MKVSIQGYKGSFHHIVATKIWGSEVELLERGNFAEVFQDVLDKKSSCGLVAIENTLTGSITETLDLLSTHNVTIIGEFILKVEQNLIVIPGTTISDLEAVYSHPVAILQCLEFFKKYPNIKLIATDDTGGSVRKIIEDGDKSKGSIASSLAAEIYEAEILAKNIQADKNNFTRFLIICRQKNDSNILFNEERKDTQNNKIIERKITLILHLEHKPGVLAQCLSIIAEQKGNITRIESRPIKGKPWEYTMHIDLILPSEEKVPILKKKLAPFVTRNDVKGVYIPAILPEELNLGQKVA